MEIVTFYTSKLNVQYYLRKSNLDNFVIMENDFIKENTRAKTHEFPIKLYCIGLNRKMVKYMKQIIKLSGSQPSVQHTILSIKYLFKMIRI